MRSIEFAQQLAQHFCEVIIVINVREELLIDLLISIPIHPMQVLHIELVLHLLPGMFKDIFPLGIRTIIEERLKFNAFRTSGAHIDFTHASTATNEDAALLGLYQVAPANTFHQNTCTALLQVPYPQVLRTFERCQVVKHVTVFGKECVAQQRRVCRQAHDTVTTVLQVEGECLLLFLLLLVILLMLLAFLLLVLFRLFLCLFHLTLLFSLFIQGKVFVIHSELLIGFQIEEHDVDIAFGSPASVATESGTVAAPYHGFSTEYPLGTSIVVTTLRQVVHLAFSISLQQDDILIVPSADTDEV